MIFNVRSLYHFTSEALTDWKNEFYFQKEIRRKYSIYFRQHYVLIIKTCSYSEELVWSLPVKTCHGEKIVNNRLSIKPGEHSLCSEMYSAVGVDQESVSGAWMDENIFINPNT